MALIIIHKSFGQDAYCNARKLTGPYKFSHYTTNWPEVTCLKCLKLAVEQGNLIDNTG